MEEGLGGPILGIESLPTSDEPPHWLDYEIKLTITDPAIYVDSEFIGDGRMTLEELRDKLAPVWRKHPAPVHVAIAASKDSTWERIVGVVDLVSQLGGKDISFIYRARSEIAPPPGTIDDSKTLDDAIRGCAPAQQLLREAAPLSNRAKMRFLADNLGPAIETCHCAADLALIRRILWLAMGRRLGPLTTAVRLQCAPQARHTIRASANTPWNGMTTKIEEAAGKAAAFEVIYE